MTAAYEAVQRAFDALLLKARTEGARAPTVTAVAARASLSRSSMYRFYPDVVARIQALSAPSRTLRRDMLHTKIQMLTRLLKAEKDLTKALARACAELAAEKIAMVEQLEDERLSFNLRVEHLQKQLQGRKHVRVIEGRG